MEGSRIIIKSFLVVFQRQDIYRIFYRQYSALEQVSNDNFEYLESKVIYM